MADDGATDGCWGGHHGDDDDEPQQQLPSATAALRPQRRAAALARPSQQGVAFSCQRCRMSKWVPCVLGFTGVAGRGRRGDMCWALGLSVGARPTTAMGPRWTGLCMHTLTPPPPLSTTIQDPMQRRSPLSGACGGRLGARGHVGRGPVGARPKQRTGRECMCLARGTAPTRMRPPARPTPRSRPTTDRTASPPHVTHATHSGASGSRSPASPSGFGSAGQGRAPATRPRRGPRRRRAARRRTPSARSPCSTKSSSGASW